MKLLRAASIGLSLLLLMPGTASAVPVDWQVDYTNTAGNVMVTGSFVYDADLNQFSAVNLTASDSLGISNTTYSFVSPFNIVVPNSAHFRDREDADRTGEKMLRFANLAGLTNAGGVISNAITTVFGFQPIQCLDAGCVAISSINPSLEPSQSTLIGTPIVPPIPVPAALPMLAAALGALVGLGRRRRS
jgi:hypothetical protein